MNIQYIGIILIWIGGFLLGYSVCSLLGRI